METSVFSSNRAGPGNYVTLWITALDNYMHESRVIGDEWVRFRRAVEGKSAERRSSLVQQFVMKNVAEPFIARYGSPDASVDALIPSESLKSFAEVLETRLDPESLQYV